MKDHVKIGHLTEYDALWVNGDQVMNLEIRFKIHTNVSNFDKGSLKAITQFFFYQFSDNCKIPSSNYN